jgi:hypothetical protein
VTPAEHYEAAQSLLRLVEPATTSEALAAAQVHATLALAPLAVAEVADLHAEWV